MSLVSTAFRVLRQQDAGKPLGNYSSRMWLFALWGCIGAAVNCGTEFVEASSRVKGWPWADPQGPGGGVYVVALAIKLGAGAATAAVLPESGLLPENVAVAFGIGACAPSIIKKLAQYVQGLLPPGGPSA